MNPNEQKTDIDVDIPDEVGQWAATINDGTIAFAKIDYDQHADDPTEDFANGKIYSFNRRHRHYIGDGKHDEIQDLIANKEAVRLSYFEHGSCCWMVAEGPIPAGVEFQWDGVRFAGLWVPDEDVLEDIGDIQGEERRQRILDFARSVVDQYTDWCNGNVYGFTVEAYPLKRDEDGEVIDDLDHYRKHHGDACMRESCWGFYGLGDLEEEVRSVARALLQPKKAA